MIWLLVLLLLLGKADALILTKNETLSGTGDYFITPRFGFSQIRTLSNRVPTAVSCPTADR